MHSVETESFVAEEDYNHPVFSYDDDNGYSRLRKNKDRLMQQLIGRFSEYSIDAKQVIRFRDNEDTVK